MKEGKMGTLTLIILVLFCLASRTTGGHNSKASASANVVSSSINRTTVQTSKYWHGNFCFPFFSYSCSQQTPSPPQWPSPAIMLPPPTMSSPPAPTRPPTSRPVPPPSSAPSQLAFTDQRLAVMYPVIQRFKSIITSDPFGITKTWVGSDVCSYRGFYCDHPPDNISATTVASVDFNGYQLSAPTLDGFLDLLPDIALFHVNTNKFSGTISPSIAKLQYLYELDISNNQFSGAFPMAVLGMEGLNFLDIRFNMFSGSVPPEIFFQNLNVLFLNDNNFISSLPDNLQSTHILYLTLANNKFMGPIPNDIYVALSALTEVLLLNNQLTGCLPYEIGLLEQVTIFDISNNLLTGQLPFSLSCLARVEVLNFAGNLLYGMVPDLICGLPYLANLSLSGNYFTQVGPLCRKLISTGALDVRNNCIPGLPFQRSVMECANFFSVPRICPRMENFRIVPCIGGPLDQSYPNYG